MLVWESRYGHYLVHIQFWDRDWIRRTQSNFWLQLELPFLYSRIGRRTSSFHQYDGYSSSHASLLSLVISFHFSFLFRSYSPFTQDSSIPCRIRCLFKLRRIIFLKMVSRLLTLRPWTKQWPHCLANLALERITKYPNWDIWKKGWLILACAIYTEWWLHWNLTSNFYYNILTRKSDQLQFHSQIQYLT